MIEDSIITWRGSTIKDDFMHTIIYTILVVNAHIRVHPNMKKVTWQIQWQIAHATLMMICLLKLCDSLRDKAVNHAAGFLGNISLWVDKGEIRGKGSIERVQLAGVVELTDITSFRESFCNFYSGTSKLLDVVVNRVCGNVWLVKHSDFERTYWLDCCWWVQSLGANICNSNAIPDMMKQW